MRRREEQRLQQRRWPACCYASKHRKTSKCQPTLFPQTGRVPWMCEHSITSALRSYRQLISFPGHVACIVSVADIVLAAAMRRCCMVAELSLATSLLPAGSPARALASCNRYAVGQVLESLGLSPGAAWTPAGKSLRLALRRLPAMWAAIRLNVMGAAPEAGRAPQCSTWRGTLAAFAALSRCACRSGRSDGAAKGKMTHMRSIGLGRLLPDAASSLNACTCSQVPGHLRPILGSLLLWATGWQAVGMQGSALPSWKEPPSSARARQGLERESTEARAWSQLEPTAASWSQLGTGANCSQSVHTFATRRGRMVAGPDLPVRSLPCHAPCLKKI